MSTPRPEITIQNEDHRQRVEERIEELMPCREGSADHREMTELLTAIEIWDARHRKA